MIKKDILLLHGAIGDTSQLFNLKSELEKQFNVHLFNFEGHGTNISKKEFSIELFTQNTYDYLEENQLNDISIFGYSMGGYVALNLAVIDSSKINKIITYGTKFNWSPESALKESNQLNVEKIESKIPKFASYLEGIHGLNDWKIVVSKTKKMMLDLGNECILKESNLNQIQVPVLITRGELDTMVDLNESIMASSQLANGHFLEIKEFVHPIIQNDAVLLSQIITEFLTVKQSRSESL